MPIENIPEVNMKGPSKNPDLFVFDFKINNDVVKSKIHLNMNMFSFLQVENPNAICINSNYSIVFNF